MLELRFFDGHGGGRVLGLLDGRAGGQVLLRVAQLQTNREALFVGRTWKPASNMSSVSLIAKMWKRWWHKWYSDGILSGQAGFESRDRLRLFSTEKTKKIIEKEAHIKKHNLQT